MMFNELTHSRDIIAAQEDLRGESRAVAAIPSIPTNLTHEEYL